MTITLQDLEPCVDAIFARRGSRLVVGTPLGLGKPNALLKRARTDSKATECRCRSDRRRGWSGELPGASASAAAGPFV
jgi:hypothetical protein